MMCGAKRLTQGRAGQRQRGVTLGPLPADTRGEARAEAASTSFREQHSI